MKFLVLFVTFTLTLFYEVNYARASGVDRTMEPDANGEAVVDASIQKVDDYSFFDNNYNFLKRLALVESNFGLNKTVTQANDGGIWQIRSMIYDQIKDDLSLPPILVLSDNNFRTPFRSAAAARLFILSKLNELIEDYPVSIEEQAIWWSTYYNPGADAALFINLVEEFEKANQCQILKLDMWFVIDGSGSIGSTNFQTSLEFVNQTSSIFVISPDQVRTGLMIYSSNTYFKSYLNNDLSNKNFSDVVLSTPYPGGGTSTGKAISEVFSYGFNITNGMRPLTEGVPRILVVLTDGKSQDNVTGPSNEVKAAGIETLAVGVGTGFNSDELKEIATDGLAFELTTFSQLLSILKNVVITKSCKAPAVISNDTTTSLELSPEQPRYVTLSLPNDGSIELFYNISSTGGSVILYFSGSAKQPNSALYDLTFIITAGETAITISATDFETRSLKSSGLQRSKRQSNPSELPIYMSITSTGENNNVQLDLKATSILATTTSTPLETSTSSASPLCNGIQTFVLIFSFWSLFSNMFHF